MIDNDVVVSLVSLIVPASVHFTKCFTKSSRIYRTECDEMRSKKGPQLRVPSKIKYFSSKFSGESFFLDTLLGWDRYLNI